MSLRLCKSCVVSFALALFMSWGLLFAQASQARVIGGGMMMDQEMDENLCALTFDDGPSIFTPQLLDMLKSYQIPATFFMLGQMVNHYPEIALRVAEEGHEIASHTYSHKNLRKLSFDGQKRELTLGYDSLAALGIIPTFMRPPYGSYDQRTVEIAASLGMDVVLWSMDSKDWKHLPDNYTQLASVRGTPYELGEMRGVFLFHDIHKTTVDDLPRIVTQLREAGCQRFVTLSEYLKGILDPEPPLLMSRRPKELKQPSAEEDSTPKAISEFSDPTPVQPALDAQDPSSPVSDSTLPEQNI